MRGDAISVFSFEGNINHCPNARIIKIARQKVISVTKSIISDIVSMSPWYRPDKYAIRTITNILQN